MGKLTSSEHWLEIESCMLHSKVEAMEAILGGSEYLWGLPNTSSKLKLLACLLQQDAFDERGRAGVQCHMQ